jgi:hypothetical protein
MAPELPFSSHHHVYTLTTRTSLSLPRKTFITRPELHLMSGSEWNPLRAPVTRPAFDIFWIELIYDAFEIE